MAENETDERVHWVKVRAGCSLNVIFNYLIFEQIEADVAEANILLPEMGKDYEFKATKSHWNNYPGIEVTRTHKLYGNVFERVRLILDSKKIVIHPYNGDTFEVTTKWNDDDINCDICIEDKSYDLWQISRKALSGLFFE